VNIILITAILSTMLAAMFGLGRMIRSLADEKQAPSWLVDKNNVPYRGIVFSGVAMLAGMGAGQLFPRVYLFLISSGGFALLFTYAVILATHIRFRKENGCPPEGKCQMPWFPYSSWIALFVMILVIFSMPFIPGQTSGLIAGLAMTVCFTALYFIQRRIPSTGKAGGKNLFHPGFSSEYGNELAEGRNQNRLNSKKEKNRRPD
jgi:L-asparagine transporter-like permease